MRGRGALFALLGIMSWGVVGCASLTDKWKPSTQVPPAIFLLEPRHAWTDTGIDVTAGELLFFTATGEVTWARSAALGLPVGPDGLDGSLGWRVGHYGLIGRVGTTGKSFDIGARTRWFPDHHARPPHHPFPPPPLEMSVAGRLYLGFKDFSPGDNRGAFEVTIKAAEPVVRSRR